MRNERNYRADPNGPLMARRIGPTILDIKPIGTPLSGPQVMDFMNFGNTRDVRFIFYEPW